MFTETEHPPPPARTADQRPHAVVIGSGLGGLAAAIRLGARGYRVSVHEKLEQPEPKYDGHGPVFARECNRIGEALSLGKVRQSKHKPKKNPEMPSCAQWPHNVRPDDYYLGALADRDGESIRPRLLTVDLDDPCLAGETLGRHLRAEDFPVFLSALIASADTISLEGSA